MQLVMKIVYKILKALEHRTFSALMRNDQSKYSRILACSPNMLLIEATLPRMKCQITS